MQIDKVDKDYLLTLAFKVIEDYVRYGNYKTIKELPMSVNLQINSGVFVSVYVNKKLRGCIGTFSEEEPLVANVQKMAIAAVSRDSRFSHITIDELDKLNIEMSILSPRIRITDISEIEIGKHGIYIEKESRRGTFLPQVAVDQNWTTEDFLGHCSKYKVGLDWDDWRNAEIFIFETVVIHS